MQNNNMQYAGFLVRLVAYLVDCIIVGAAILIMSIPKGIINMLMPDSFFDFKVLFTFTVWDISMYILTIAYFVGFTYFFSATIGKKLLKIKVISPESEKLGIWSTLYRETIGRYLSSVLCGLGYLVIAFDGQKRGIQDMLADTRVVYDFKVNNETKFENKNDINTENNKTDFVPQQTAIEESNEVEFVPTYDIPENNEENK